MANSSRNDLAEPPFTKHFGSLPPKTPDKQEAISRRSQQGKVVETVEVVDPGTKIAIKQHSNQHVFEGLEKPKKMTLTEINKSIARELSGAVRRDVASLVDDVFRGQTIDWDVILKQMTSTDGDEEEKYYDTETRSWGDWPPTHKRNTENQLCVHLNKVADIVRNKMAGGRERKAEEDALVYSSRFATKGLRTEFTNAREPDLVIVPRSLENSEELSFADFRSAISLKSNPLDKNEELQQLAEYARVSFAHQRDRRFFLGIGFRDTKLTVHVFDRSGVLVSCDYDAHDDPKQFLRIATGVLFLTPEQLGYDTTFDKIDDECFLEVKAETYKITENIYVDRSIRGRGTLCLKVERVTDKRKGEVKVIKDAWVDCSRVVKEVEMMKILRECEIENVSKMIGHEVVQIMNWKTNEMEDDNTGIFRTDAALMDTVEIREHHRIVMEPYGEPITNFSSLTELLSALLDIVKTIEELDSKGILHRDISIDNLILVPVEGSNIRKGYIIDFDYAIKKDMKGKDPAKGQRTGTLPFMALEILKKSADHSAIHDAESVFYVLIWITFILAGPNGTNREMTVPEYDTSILSHWCPDGDVSDTDLVNIATSKKSLMTNEASFKEEIIGRMDPYFQPLKKCLLLLRLSLFPPDGQSITRFPELNDDLEEEEEEDSDGPKNHRKKDEVFSRMKRVLAAAIQSRSKREGLEISSEPQVPGKLIFSDAAGTSVTEREEPVYAIHLIRSMKLRDRRAAYEAQLLGESVHSPEVPAAPKKQSFLVQVLNKSHRESQSQMPKKRSIAEAEEQAVVDDTPCPRAVKRSRGSQGSASNGRSATSMSSANNDLQ